MIQLAIVGLGSWGRRLVEAVQDKSDRVRFVAAVAPRPDKVRDFVTAKNMRLTSDYGDVLADGTIQGIVSCGPAQLHADHTFAALEAGKPVLAVKPMALRAEEAIMLASAARRHGVLLALGYNRCFMAHVAALRAEIRAGTLGDLLHVEGDFCVNRHFDIKGGGWKASPDIARPGSLSDHALYLAIEMLGPLADVHAIARHDVSDNGLADVTAVLARAQSGSSAFLTAIGTTADLFRFHVFGTKGWAELRGDTGFRLETTDGRKVDVQLPPVDPELLQVEAFADALSGRAGFPVPVADAVNGVAVLEAIARSAASGGMVRVAQTQS